MTRRVSARRAIAIGAVALGVITLSGCGSTPVSAGGSSSAAVSRSAVRAKRLVLAQFATGVGAISPGSTAPVWSDPAAVSAIDGSAVFSVRRDGSERLVRIDRETGSVVASWPVSSGLWINAVAPAGRWVALTNRRPGDGDFRGGGHTDIVVFDTTASSEVRRVTLAGNLRPEAFAVDGKSIFALDYRGDHYRVQTIDVATGFRFDTNNRDKRIAPEDMHGASVRGVMSADRTVLATLYRNPTSRTEPAFVHILDLEHGWSYCADLPPPFGLGPPGSDVVELTPIDTVVVAATRAGLIAEIHIDSVHTPGAPVHVEYRDGTVASDSIAFRSTPGFGHVIVAFPT